MITQKDLFVTVDAAMSVAIVLIPGYLLGGWKGAVIAFCAGKFITNAINAYLKTLAAVGRK